MWPEYCAVCGKCFASEHFHTGGGGDLVAFADFDDSAARAGYLPGIVGADWICNQHLSAAWERTGQRKDDAIADIQRVFGVRRSLPSESKQYPELFLVDVGANRAKVFAIVRQATSESPKTVRNLVDCLPAKIAEGWPAQFEIWRTSLNEAGATVEVRWD